MKDHKKKATKSDWQVERCCFIMVICFFDPEEDKIKSIGELLEKKEFGDLNNREQEIAITYFYKGVSFGKDHFWVELDQKIQKEKRESPDDGS